MSDVIIVIDKQDLVDIADLVRYKSGLSGELSLGGVYNTIRDYWPEGEYFLTFSAPETFSISVTNPGWDGTLEYSTDKSSWSTWNGEEISGTELYLRGTGNTGITSYIDGTVYKWTLIGSNISCSGNIETLLDWETVKSGEHPEMVDYCYYEMFYKCTSLIQAPELPATKLVNYCYGYMFQHCTNLTQAPELPATTLADYCYVGMFWGCTNLTQAPELPATTLASDCYYRMFYSCTSLTQAPELPATTLASNCYYWMFYSCTSLTQAPELSATTLASHCCDHMFYYCTALTQAPELPATTLADYCYQYMFLNCTLLAQAPELPATTLTDGCYYGMFTGCTALTQAPELPATILAKDCYVGMFSNCTNLTQAPALPATTLASDCYSQMFYGCTNLTQAPELPATTLARYCYSQMFQHCTTLTQAPALPATILADYCYQYMFYGCANIKLSSTQTDEYTQPYRIPSAGTGTTVTDTLNYMFSDTGGTFTGTPEINTTYYLHKDCSIIGGAIEVPTPTWEWGEDGAEVDAEWFAGLKDYLLTNSGSSLTTSEGNSIVGTTKSVTLTSEVLGTTTHLIRVIGVDQDADNTVTWQTKNCLANTTTFGSSAVWIDSTARSLCQSYYSAFPGKDAIKTVSKGTCPNISTGSSHSDAVTYNDETVFLLSEREFGLNSKSPLSTANSSTSKAECTQGKNFSYSYYTSNSSRIMYRGDSSTSNYGYPWERSRYYNDSDYVCIVRTDGSAGHNIYSYGVGLAPAFVIGN